MHYVADAPRRSVISRFRNAEGTEDFLDPASEEILMEIPQPEGRAYAIPDDNPFRDREEGIREEFFAWGFRDPSGIGFEPGSGRLWVTDRGRIRVDELNLVGAGGDYGWAVVEAGVCHRPATDCDPSRFEAPVFEYGGSGLPGVLVGGDVYRGARNPELAGRYLMADGRCGSVWAVDFDGAAVLAERIVAGPPGWIAIGIDGTGEPLFINAEEGRIYRFVWTAS